MFCVGGLKAFFGTEICFRNYFAKGEGILKLIGIPPLPNNIYWNSTNPYLEQIKVNVFPSYNKVGSLVTLSPIWQCNDLTWVSSTRSYHRVVAGVHNVSWASHLYWVVVTHLLLAWVHHRCIVWGWVAWRRLHGAGFF